MLATSRSLLHRTASAFGWLAPTERTGQPASLAHAITLIAQTAIEGGYSAGVSVGSCLPIRSPATACFGLSNLETQTDVRDDTLFRTGACTRQITAAATLLLMERNLLRLSDPVSRFLLRPSDGEDKDLQTLLTGEHDAYCQLGRVIEHVASMRFPDFIADTLLIPAGMDKSRLADPTRILPNRASGYRLSDNHAHDFRNAAPGPSIVASDGLYTTAGDLLRWNRALHGGRLLTPDTLQRMTTAAGSAVPCPVLAPFAERPMRAMGLSAGGSSGIALIGSAASHPGFDTWLFHFPDDRIDLALLANTEHGAGTILEPMLRAILRA